MSRSAKSSSRSGTVLASARHVLGGDLMRGARADLRMASRGFRWGRGQLVPRSAEPYVITQPKPPFPTAWARTPAVNIVREGVQRLALAPLLRSEIQPIVHGQDLLERMGPRSVVFVANHTSHLDTPLILCSLPDDWRRRTAVAAAADYFFDTWWRATGSALVFNTFPIERRGGTLSSTPGDLLSNGWNVVVFPEGTRSPDGWTRPFRLGAAFLAAQHGVPVVPIGIRGSFAAMPRGRGWPVPGRPAVTVRFGEPLFQQEGEGDARARRPDRSRRGRAGRRGHEHVVGVQAARRPRPDTGDVRTRRGPVAPGLGLDRVAARRASDQDLAPLALACCACQCRRGVMAAAALKAPRGHGSRRAWRWRPRLRR